MIVDDSRETLAGLSCYFSRRFKVLEALDGSQGLQLLEAGMHAVDLVISDLLMPEISGARFILTIKSRFPALPVIAMTGWVVNPEELIALTKADCILCKPFDLEQLDEQVARLLARR